MNVLVTAIGSMSAEAVINSLKRNNHLVIGTDIYQEDWIITAKYVDKFYKVPYPKEDNYIVSLINICKENNITFIIPLTDTEIDILIDKKDLFDANGLILGVPDTKAVKVARDKFELYKYFKNYTEFKVIPTYKEPYSLINDFSEYIIAKPRNGRSSEGLLRINKNIEQIKQLENKYIYQPEIKGTIITIDTIRDQYNNIVSIARKELLRTINGAGLVVELFYDKRIFKIAKVITSALNIVGCINIELIYNNNDNYYLLDVNPRFSAGIAFSAIAGYNFIENHLKCFYGLEIDKQINYEKKIISKRYNEICH
ncbi:MAG: hypothetical protein B6D44_02100 [Ignavibacteriales bacterium UTCHB2]|jgi:carbamoyl-phosphate synthase large subunit|nr:MAG: hypothetical protein B6D44_02100 [Ignavibacteriales bacterium UTCHB2]HQI41287.1 ATP-grasp domain-containing protein [Ignavibacteriaceae bacterium]